MSSQQQKEIERRRTFGIISHPDAGKTTLTEKLLLFGGAIQMAGAVKSRKTAMHATSDWMAIERERGISVTTSVMKFNYRDYEINLLDTPGHQDFSEDTYRVLTAVDSALMVIDSAKGVETQTTKLMEVCRMRNTPIITFINKLDREGLDPLDLLADIEEKLQIECVPGLPAGVHQPALEQGDRALGNARDLGRQGVLGARPGRGGRRLCVGPWRRVKHGPEGPRWPIRHPAPRARNPASCRQSAWGSQHRPCRRRCRSAGTGCP